jgi:hypothetical protein
MLKIIFTAIALLLAVTANAKTKFDITGLQGSWTGLSCDSGKAYNSHFSRWSDEGKEYYGFSGEYVGNIDSGSFTFKDGDCSWGFCSTLYKTKSKAKTVAVNKMTVQQSHWSKGPLDIFWSGKWSNQIVYELVEPNKLKRSHRYTEGDDTAWKTCYFERKL